MPPAPQSTATRALDDMHPRHSGSTYDKKPDNRHILKYIAYSLIHVDDEKTPHCTLEV
jgi:hypothetical protein